jgi:hypothetical protein
VSYKGPASVRSQCALASRSYSCARGLVNQGRGCVMCLENKYDLRCSTLLSDAHLLAQRWMTDAVQFPLCRHITRQLGVKLLGLLSKLNLLEHAIPTIPDKPELYHYSVAFETQSAFPEHLLVNTGGTILLRAFCQGYSCALRNAGEDQTKLSPQRRSSSRLNSLQHVRLLSV